ncbi:2-oxoacid:acceptor oxidoreductase family protein [Candidatus Bipolaricaulota bacterium]|nr:2-oxoacid:acceptor oxidoreductase family protein [Candidatus Bipolaricaulota bacterium]
MERSIIIAGFGGQGVILAGKILARAAMDHGLSVTWLPSYGPEMRGGTANCTVVLSDEPIGSPIVDEATALIALNLPSLNKFEDSVAGGGTIIVNRSLIDSDVSRSDVTASYVDMNGIARDEVGNPRAINMVALGAYVKASGSLPLQVVTDAMAHFMRESGKDKFIEMNAKALEAGYNAA